MFILILVFINCVLFPKWEKIEGPKEVTYLENIKSGTDFIVGSRFDPYFSFDNGQSWELRNNGLPEKRGAIQQIEVENDIVYVYTLRTTSVLESYLCFSTDKGLTWNKVGENQDFTEHRILSDFKIQNDVIYTLPYSKKFITKSTDFGQTWDTLGSWSNDLEHFDYMDINNDTIVIADGGASGQGIYCSGVLVSIDGGETWENRNNGLDVCDITCLKIKGKNIYIGKKVGFYYSENLGENWKRAGSLVYNKWINDIEIIQDTLCLATESGLFKSIDLWKEWIEIQQFKAQRVYDLYFDNNSLFFSTRDSDYSNYYSYISSNMKNFDTLNFEKKINYASFVVNFPDIYFSTNNFSNNKIFKSKNLNLEINDILIDNQSERISDINIYNNKLVCKLLRSYSSSEPREFLISQNKGESWERKKFFDDATFPRDILLLNNDSILISSSDKLYIYNDFDEFSSTFSTNDSLVTKDLNNNMFFKKINNKIYLYGKGGIYETDKNLSYWTSILKKIDYSKKDSINSLYGKSIVDISVSKSDIYIISDNNLVSKSENYGKTWSNLNFNKLEDITYMNLFTIGFNIFLNTSKGLFLSKNNGETWNELNDGIFPDSYADECELHLYSDTLIYKTNSGIYYRPLLELGITLSTEKTERRNYLWTYPPYPHPTNSIVKVETYWDSGLPFSEKDIEIYDITGLKINTNETLTLQKESIHKGHIIWDVSNQKPGIYIMKITHGTETRVRKIMVVE